MHIKRAKEMKIELLLLCVVFVINKSTNAEVLQPQNFTNIDLSGCGSTKGCYRVPENCTSAQNCTHLVTWVFDGTKIHFELSSQVVGASQWTALGLSLDQTMGDDSVTDCIENSGVTVQSSWNTEAPSNIVLSKTQYGLEPGQDEGSYSNGVLQCSFTRFVTVANSSSKDTNNPIYNITQPFYLFLARGPASGGIKNRHRDPPAISPQNVTLNSKKYVNIGGQTIQSNSIITAHGTIMIIAWMFFASIGILMPKYYSTIWNDVTICSKLLWFQVHRAFMLTAGVLTIIGFIIIFAHIKGYAKNLEGADAAHPALGILVFILVILNSLLGLFRPSSQSPLRPIYNSVHFMFGTVSHLAAVIAIFLGVRLEKAHMSQWSQWVVIGYIVWFVFVKLLLHKHEKNISSGGPGYSSLEGNGTAMSDLSTDKARVKSVNVFKSVLIIVHSIVLFACSVALITDLAKSKP